MKNNQQLTKKDLFDIFKEAGVATKSDIEQFEKRLTTRIEGVETKLGQVEAKLTTKIDKLERSLKLRIGKERNKIMYYIGQLASHSPTLTAFNQLKERVDRYISPS